MLHRQGISRAELRSSQDPVRARYRDDAASARATLEAKATLEDGVTCSLNTALGRVTAGLHKSTGGDGSLACSGDMLLEALAACAGVTLLAVATAMEIEVRSGSVHVEGDLDWRGTLGMDRQVPVGFSEIRLRFELDADASEQQLDRLLQSSERYCVVYQTLAHSPRMQVSLTTAEDPVSSAR